MAPPLDPTLRIRGMAPPLVPTLRIRGMVPPLLPTIEDQTNGSACGEPSSRIMQVVQLAVSSCSYTLVLFLPNHYRYKRQTLIEYRGCSSVAEVSIAVLGYLFVLYMCP